MSSVTCLLLPVVRDCPRRGLSLCDRAPAPENDANDEDLRSADRPDRRAPALDAAGDKEVGPVFFEMAPAEVVLTAGDEIDGEQLAVMGMARELDVGAGTARLGEVDGPVGQENDGKIAGRARQELRDGHPARRSAVLPAGQGQSIIDPHDLVLKQSDPGPFEEMVIPGTAEPLVIPRDAIDPVPGGHAAEGPLIAARVLVPAVAFQHVPSDKDHVGALGIDLGRELLQEAIGRQFPKMEVGHEDDGQLRGGGGPPGKLDAILLDAKHPVVDGSKDDDKEREDQRDGQAPAPESAGPHGFP
jgi:hypothetical protein